MKKKILFILWQQVILKWRFLLLKMPIRMVEGWEWNFFFFFQWGLGNSFIEEKWYKNKLHIFKKHTQAIRSMYYLWSDSWVSTWRRKWQTYPLLFLSNSADRGAGRTKVPGVTKKAGTWLNNWTHMHKHSASCIATCETIPQSGWWTCPSYHQIFSCPIVIPLRTFTFLFKQLLICFLPI